MNCWKCNERLKVTHTYVLPGVGKTRRLCCPVCNRVYVSEEVLSEATNGNGAYARLRGLNQLAKERHDG